MFEKIINFSIKNKLVIGIMTLALIVWGLVSLSQLPFDSTPDITNNQVQVITQAPTLGTEEVEQYVTTPLEMAFSNIPDIVERRSISRSGLSVVTLVFKDDVDVYWARQQVSQQLKEAEEQIPNNAGKISLAPISTGLGEIYQYTIHPKKGYEDKFTLSDIRTVQDWIVRKQFAGTEGVAEVNGWGGYVKQYEVAVNIDQLTSYGLTISDLYKAIEDNNENTGGSYIEQGNNQYFIRGIGLTRTLEDIRQIPVKSINGISVLVKDVADVRLGHAMRYGAVTRNGEGEVVSGITLMLKGENFQDVIKNVKDRITQIQKSLPEGLVIEPFIDRTQLVDRVTFTITENLVLGLLIVMFVLVLFLGNIRAGLVVASVIPLAMMFAFGMMKTFGVGGNLMSLGALDFGIIVDGAVIIVECVTTFIVSYGKSTGKVKLSQADMDIVVSKGSNKIRKSAAFGEIIIMTVYVPLFTLVGIEGKMFRPMAMTVFFAVLGAFILSLTYVPMASSLFLSRKTQHKKTFSDKMMRRLCVWYHPLLKRSLKHSKIIVGTSVAIFAGALFIFSQMGGEFIPNLEEGDLCAELSMKQGTSLTKMIETTTQAEKILKKQFPEVKQVVTRIGSSEIPTDPMPVERADMMIQLKPKSEWTTAKTQAELSELMGDAMSKVDGLRVEMSQPIQMRTNELITGVKQDVAINIYGNNIDTLATLAKRVAENIKDIEGVGNPVVERVSGLPQLQVIYDRARLAAYGISIRDANNTLKSAYAGAIAGSVFEEDRRFDIVLRIDKQIRDQIETIQNLQLPVPSGGTIPLAQVAEIKYVTAPSQITHDEGQRRIYVGFNVRGRDIETTIDDIEEKLTNEFKLPTGYYYTYGGQFENLKEAKSRLSIAVPVALFIIFFLLFLTLKSMREVLIVFTEIPLAAIGGIVALWLRGMPFSISAGVGFIALFGVVVLNGIVLINQFNDYEKQGITDINQRIINGCMHRLRPVLMTALVASLGFLPMAISNSDGAEVQRPLATVVIGGLFIATILTLIVLPSIYKLYSKKNEI
ncbi:MAG: CusA/CzcA family heavy metal efflux RND transporter [Prevotella sp.]|nr:CusA/CzcA family heavy metal efflux RND transporter [Prevotella sp.]MDY4020100.1 CusA/CzcA family heavy metal efflux RND transporter [Prevotella sp.]